MLKSLNIKLTKKIKELRRAPEQRKKRWLVGGSAVLMFFVITLWFSYLNLTLPSLKQVDEKNTPENQDKESFLKTFKTGFEIVSNNFKNGFDNIKQQINNSFGLLKNQLDKSNEFNLKSRENNFSPQEQEPVTKTPLP